MGKDDHILYNPLLDRKNGYEKAEILSEGVLCSLLSQ